MKYIELTQGKRALVDNADFEYLNQWKWYYSGRLRGTSYAVRRGPEQTKIYMHKLIVNKPGFYTDHIDGNGLNNQRSNLRYATNQQNQANTSKQINNKTGYKGVYASRNKWRARLHILRKGIDGGTYDTKEEAAIAYNRLAIKHFGEFARLNKV